jgi:hypothetical protein
MIFSNLKKLILPFAASMIFIGCEKPETTDQLGDNGQKILSFKSVGGLQTNFSNSTLVLDPTSSSETVEFQLEYLGPQVFENDVTVTVNLDDAARVTYNATSGPFNQYVAMPDSMYTINTTTAVIKAGDVFSSTLSITLNPSYFDPAVSYMIPITITNISGAPADVKKAPSTGTAYFHVIGNPLAGSYLSNGYFYHPSAARDIVDEPKDLIPASSTKLICDMGDFGGAYTIILETDPLTNKVTISKDPNSGYPGVAGTTYVQFDDALPASNPGYTAAWPSSDQCNNTYDPTTQTFKLRYAYMGGSGYRVSEEFVVKQ